jgi:hypothetical protein
VPFVVARREVLNERMPGLQIAAGGKAGKGGGQRRANENHHAKRMIRAAGKWCGKLCRRKRHGGTARLLANAARRASLRL